MSISPEQFPQSPESNASGSSQPRQQASNSHTSPPPADSVASSDSEMTLSSAENPTNPSSDEISSPSQIPHPQANQESGEKTQAAANAEGSCQQQSEPRAEYRLGPIPAPSEPMQYRAIGLVRGRYIASANQFTQGILLTTDGTVIDAVLLGRIMSLVKKHLDLEKEHLWVTYPRTRQKDGTLHTQIVGVWEPETLAPAEAKNVSRTELSAPIVDGYFSIRGEVIFQSQEQEYLIVKIRQAARKPNEKPKFFKLKLKGTLQAKAVGHFWELDVMRQANTLVIQNGKDIGPLPGKKKPTKKSFKSRRGGAGKQHRSSKQPRKGPQKNGSPPPARKESVAKPIVKRRPPHNPPQGGS
ncbi:MAG: hypothetical protein N3E45_01890 [Oscillatoriaceae bacterium SKW80]|nr:hypothetical protein [Oscillatoriaceae bacterium SKYG93]MCX8119579.1 hypothetical protein [Oscillatoriaceae bacterium SKW80]MDW8455046.1 hypothetical protein [Oscillatoriaceae cyanobacterium SKYGB_i_bin93]HIK28177.1 hypothetical protein [Oscillatoriaceae cyanobacterium M7585_C2015_266]